MRIPMEMTLLRKSQLNFSHLNPATRNPHGYVYAVVFGIDKTLMVFTEKKLIEAGVLRTGIMWFVCAQVFTNFLCNKLRVED